jgi:membrane protein involved in colicin uptake
LKVKLEAEATAAVELKAKQVAEAKAAADQLAAEKLAAAKAASLKKITITCIKGNLTKKVTSISPKCPTGYKKK